MDIEGTFWIASCTKLLTGICALQQVEKGLIDPDEDISRILPELKDVQVITADEGAPGGYTLSPKKGKVTLRQLLTHTSGVGYEFMNPTLQSWRAQNGPPREELVGKVRLQYLTPLVFEPGQSWQYGGGIDWAGIMVERLNPGYTLGAYMSEKIFTPLKMTSTTFHIDRSPGILARLVPCVKREEDGTFSVSETNGFSTTMEEHSGGGGLWSSVTDYTKVLADLISPVPTLLKTITINTLLAAPQLSPGSAALEPLVSQRGGAIAANAAALKGTPPVNYGCGGLVTTKDTEVLPAGSLSWGGLPNLKWFINRELGVAAMYATQILPPSDKLSNELSSAFFVEVLRLHGKK